MILILVTLILLLILDAPGWAFTGWMVFSIIVILAREFAPPKK